MPVKEDLKRDVDRLCAFFYGTMEQGLSRG